MAYTKAQLEALNNELLASNQPIPAVKHRQFNQHEINELYDAQSRGNILKDVQTTVSSSADDNFFIIKANGQAYLIEIDKVVNRQSIDYEGDLNILFSPGEFYVKGLATNTPYSFYSEGWIKVRKNEFGYLIQEFVDMFTRAGYARVYDLSSWSDWERVSGYNRGEWNTTDELPTNGSGGPTFEICKFDRWIVPDGGWSYTDNGNVLTFPKWSILEAMEDGASTFEQFKYPY